MDEHEFRLQAPELRELIENGEIKILHREKDELLKLRLTGDVETEKVEAYTVEEKP